MMGYGIWMALSSIFSGLMGGGLVWIFNIRANKKKANSEAKNSEAIAEGAEITNVEKAIKIWREMAESLKKELADQRAESDAMRLEIQKLRCELRKLNRGNNKIIEALESINDKNYNEIATRVKEELKHEA